MPKYNVKSILDNPYELAEAMFEMMEQFSPRKNNGNNRLFFEFYNNGTIMADKALSKSCTKNIDDADGFKFWEYFFEGNESIIDGISALKEEYLKEIKKEAVYNASELETFQTCFMIGNNKKYNKEAKEAIKSAMGRALENLVNVNNPNTNFDNMNKINSVCDFLNTLDTAKENSIKKYVSNLLNSIEESEKLSYRNSHTSGVMYHNLKELSKLLEKGIQPDDEMLNLLSKNADTYLDHKKVDGYNEKANGKIIAAYGIKTLVDAFKDHDFSQMELFDKDMIPQSLDMRIPVVLREGKKVSYTKLLKEEVNKTKTEEKTKKVSKTEKSKEKKNSSFSMK